MFIEDCRIIRRRITEIKLIRVSIRDIHVDLHFSRLFISNFNLRDVFYRVTASHKVT